MGTPFVTPSHPLFPLPPPLAVQLPALVLDCDMDVDVERDMEYRLHVAKQVKEYTEYVRALTQSKATASAQVGGEDRMHLGSSLPRWGGGTRWGKGCT